MLETYTIAANVTCDAVLFVKAAFEKVDESWFTSFLVEESSAFLRFQLTPRTVKINKKEVNSITQGLNAVIEAAILATRLNITQDGEEKEEMRKQMERYFEIVEKCGGPQEKDAIGFLEERWSF